jgi:hypothetical protein
MSLTGGIILVAVAIAMLFFGRAREGEALRGLTDFLYQRG